VANTCEGHNCVVTIWQNGTGLIKTIMANLNWFMVRILGNIFWKNSSFESLDVEIVVFEEKIHTRAIGR
jgi:hypothetical protein